MNTLPIFMSRLVATLAVEPMRDCSGDIESANGELRPVINRLMSAFKEAQIPN